MSETPLPIWKPPMLEAEVSTDTPFVGQTVVYTLRVAHPPEVSVKLPTKISLEPYILNGVRQSVEPASASARASKKLPEGVVVERFELDLGIYTLEGGPIPSLTLQVETPEGPAQLVVEGPVLVVQTTTAEEGAEPKALAPPVSLWMPDHTLLHVAGIALGVVLLTLIVWRLVRGFLARRRARPTRALPPRPLDERALSALDALQREGLVAAGKRRLFFFALSEILRAYLGERFAFDALECTTHELLIRLRDRPTPGLDHARFENWCEVGDLAKFARHDPSDAECSDALTEAVQIIRATTAAVAPAPTAAPASPASPESGVAA